MKIEKRLEEIDEALLDFKEALDKWYSYKMRIYAIRNGSVIYFDEGDERLHRRVYKKEALNETVLNSLIHTQMNTVERCKKIFNRYPIIKAKCDRAIVKHLSRLEELRQTNDEKFVPLKKEA